MYPMPKTNSNPHPLAVARKCLGWTQARLAEKAGVAAVTIKKIESRTLKPSEGLAGRLMWVTGLNAGCIVSGGPAMFLDMPYCAELGRAHVDAMATKSKTGDPQMEEWVEDSTVEMMVAVTALMRAAAMKNAFHPVGFLFEHWAQSVVADFKLGPELCKTPAAKGTILERLQKESRRKTKA